MKEKGDRRIIGEGLQGTTEEELQERGEKGNRLRGPSVVGRRTLQIPVNRIQLRCYREYR